MVELFFDGCVFSVSVKAVKPVWGGVNAVEQKAAEETVFGILDEGLVTELIREFKNVKVNSKVSLR